MNALHPLVIEERVAPAAETLASRFARVCAAQPDRVALTFDTQHVTYAELDQRSDAVAQELSDLGAGPGRLVAIELDRGVDMMAAMLGVAKTGAAYLPIDPAYPPARIAETLDDACPIAVVGREGIRARAGWLALDERAAYVIYTSGSTGTPKGVVVSQQNVLRLFDETAGWFGFGPDDVWTMFHSFAFDFSVWEIWGALLTGGRLVVVPFHVSRNPEAFWALLQTERVTVLNQTPSAFGLLDSVDAAKPSNALALRVVIFGGEALSLGALRGWITRHGDAKPELINMYGITETTVHVTYRRIRSADLDDRESLIGQPIRDLTLQLLDDSLAPVPDGEEGEICIGGGGIALGYLRRPELSAERFVQGKLYRSGDMARRRPDGELVYLGRRDGQVKIAGFRIETGEVESALLACPGVSRACVAAWDGRLVAFVVGSSLSPASLAEALSTTLPAHMRPALYRIVDSLPLTVNGKVDRAQLLQSLPSATPLTSPTSATVQQKITAIWTSILGVESIAPDENFFDAGGTSLLLVRVRAALQTELARDIPVVWMFQCTTIRALAAKLADQPADKASTAIDNAQKARLAFGRAKALRGTK